MQNGLTRAKIKDMIKLLIVCQQMQYRFGSADDPEDPGFYPLPDSEVF